MNTPSPARTPQAKLCGASPGSRARPPISRGRLGFNGECLERSGVQILGSYRAYNPCLMRFHSPDNLSPFNRGGFNSYAYCLGDPVNRVDPTGHFPWWVWRALTPTRIAFASVPFIAGTIIGAVKAPEEKTQTLLIWAAALLAGIAIAVPAASWGLKIVSPARYQAIKASWNSRATRPSRQANLETVSPAGEDASIALRPLPTNPAARSSISVPWRVPPRPLPAPHQSEQHPPADLPPTPDGASGEQSVRSKSIRTT